MTGEFRYPSFMNRVVTTVNLTQFRYLIAIVDAGLNITQAAERVYATQPGISKQLRQLEGELGFQIFRRKGKSLDAVTPAGAQVIERARTIVAEATNIRSLAENLRNASSGELRIATTHTQAKYVLPASIAAMTSEFSDVGIHLLPAGETEALALLESGEVDLAIVSTVGQPPEVGCAIPVYQWQRHIVVPGGHELALSGEALTFESLARFPLVSYDSSRRSDSSLRLAFMNAGVEPRISCTAQDAELIKTYVRAGLGVGILAEMAWLPEDGSDLARIPADELFPTCTTWLLLPRDTVLREFVLRFIQGLVPWLHPRDLIRALETGEKIDWMSLSRTHYRSPDQLQGQLPCWQELLQQRQGSEVRKLKTARRKLS